MDLSLRRTTGQALWRCRFAVTRKIGYVNLGAGVLGATESQIQVHTVIFGMPDLAKHPSMMRQS